MNDGLYVYISGEPRGLNYNPMYKFKNFEELEYRVETDTDVPEMDEIVVTGYRGDNIVSVNETFEQFFNNLKMIYR